MNATFSIIGAGNVGTALARRFARSGIAVGIANSRGPETIPALGDGVTALALDDALRADVVILALPFRAHAEVARLRPDWSGTIFVDAMNTYGVDPADLRGRASSDVVADAFAGAQVVKTLNQLPAKLLAQDPADHGGRRVMFVSSNDDAAAATVAGLLERLGYAPIGVGRIDAGGRLLDKGGPLVLQNLVKLG